MDRGKREFREQSGFGSIFKGIGNFIDLLTDMVEKGETEFSGPGEIEGLKGRKELKGVYGFSVRVGGLGGPFITVEPFGNIRETAQGPSLDEVREPIVDLSEEGGEIIVIAEVPGVDEKEVSVELNQQVLTFTAKGPHRKYSKEILLKEGVSGTPPRWTIKNGILRIALEKG